MDDDDQKYRFPYPAGRTLTINLDEQPCLLSLLHDRAERVDWREFCDWAGEAIVQAWRDKYGRDES